MRSLCVGFCGLLWASGASVGYWGFCGFLWGSMGFHGLLWASMGFYALLWASVNGGMEGQRDGRTVGRREGRTDRWNSVRLEESKNGRV